MKKYIILLPLLQIGLTETVPLVLQNKTTVPTTVPTTVSPPTWYTCSICNPNLKK